MNFAETFIRLNKFRFVGCGLNDIQLAVKMIDNVGIVFHIADSLVTTFRSTPGYDVVSEFGDENERHALGKTAVFDWYKLEAWFIGCFVAAARQRRLRRQYGLFDVYDYKSDSVRCLLWLDYRDRMTSKMKDFITLGNYSRWIDLFCQKFYDEFKWMEDVYLGPDTDMLLTGIQEFPLDVASCGLWSFYDHANLSHNFDHFETCAGQRMIFHEALEDFSIHGQLFVLILSMYQMCSVGGAEQVATYTHLVVALSDLLFFQSVPQILAIGNPNLTRQQTEDDIAVSLRRNALAASFLPQPLQDLVKKIVGVEKYGTPVMTKGMF